MECPPPKRKRPSPVGREAEQDTAAHANAPCVTRDAEQPAPRRLKLKKRQHSKLEEEQAAPADAEREDPDVGQEFNPLELEQKETTIKTIRGFDEREHKKRLIVVLENACVEVIKNGKEYQLMNSDDHAHLLTKKGRDVADARPDILHFCLLNLLDSPLNKAGLLQVYVHAKNNVLIEVNPRTRIPRTCKRFCGLMVQLLHKMSIKSPTGNEKLLSVIKNPVTQYFPIGCKKIGTSVKAKGLVSIDDFVAESIGKDEPVVFVIGAMAHGKVEAPYVDTEVAISEYPLSAAIVCTKVCSAFEKLWGVL